MLDVYTLSTDRGLLLYHHRLYARVNILFTMLLTTTVDSHWLLTLESTFHHVNGVSFRC